MHVTIVTQLACPWCEHAQEILDRLSREYRIDVAPIPISEPEARQLAERSGMVFPPGVFLDGRLFSYGRLSERKLRRELDRRGDVRRRSPNDPN